jgi:hypothetical protein
MNNVAKGLTWAIILGFVPMFLLIILPLGSLWALNTLFALGLPYTFKTWLAALILSSAVSSKWPSPKTSGK